MNTNKTIENLFSQVRNDVTVPSYETFLQRVTKQNEERNTLQGWKIIPSVIKFPWMARVLVGVTLVAVLVLPMVYSSQVSDLVLVTISEEGDREIAFIENEDAFITYALDQYLQQLVTING